MRSGFALFALGIASSGMLRGTGRAALVAGASIGISTIVLFELWYGVARSQRRRENADRLRVLLAGAFDVVPFDRDDSAIAGDLGGALEAEATPIGPFDLLIAVQANRTRATLVTANISEFARVDALAWEDWTMPDGDPLR